MPTDLEQIYERLFAYCAEQEFAGYDPFDGLNSRVFQVTPLQGFRLTRLAWLQVFKRSSVNLRPALFVKKSVNPKAVALFALAELSRFRATGDVGHEINAKDLIDRLLKLKIKGETADGLTTTAFGYNFDWQSRVFYAPKGTAAIVPTAFALEAIIESYRAFGDGRHLEIADEICTFILTGLNRPVETDDELCFSYTPLDNTQVYNASLLAGESLARVGAIINNDEYLGTAAKSARFVIRRQREYGAWSYGGNDKQAWVDNFHTAYVLLSLKRIADRVPDVADEANDAIERGRQYWLDYFFLDDGTPKYYDKSVYPIDIHSAAAAIVALCELGQRDFARQVAEWTAANMYDASGYFYYQIRKNGTVKTPYMRWGQAWMAYALARLVEAEK
jgi:hypothetical protein